MEKFHDQSAPKVESHHSLFSDAYDFGAQLLKSANKAVHENPNAAVAIGVIGVVANHGKGAGVLAEDLIALEGKAAARAGVSGETGVAAETGAQRLLAALREAETPGEANLAILKHGNFDRSYEGYRRFFGP